MKKLGRLIAVLGLPALLASQFAHAEDIDLYTGMSPGSSTDVPTVLLVWDNAANTSASASPICASYADGSGAPSLGTDTAAGMEQCAMYNALYKIQQKVELQGKIKIGLMIFNDNQFNSGNGQCGYLKFAPQIMDHTNVTALMNTIKGFDKNIKSNSIKIGGTMAEAWAMLNGRDATYSCSGVDYSKYATETSQCRDPILVYIGNAFTNSNPSDNNQDPELKLKNELTTAFNYATGSNQYNFFTSPISVPLINTSGTSNSKYWADEWARFMKRVPTIDSALPDRNISTYTISVTDFSNQSQAQPVINYYAEMATQGGGKSFVVDFRDSDGLTNALLNLFNDVQAKNSVFASATLPVAANTQGTYLNQVFIAMFRPAEGARPRWYGNLKQYHFGLDAGGKIVLTDSTYDPDTQTVVSKTNPETGALSTDAVSFWTTNTPVDSTGAAVAGWPSQGFWVNAASGAGLQYDKPDGDLVEKGGAGQMGRVDNVKASYASTTDDNSRNLLTCNGVGTCGTALTQFDMGNTYLTSNASTVFGVNETGVFTAGITAGIPFTTGYASCQAGGNKTCSITVPLNTDAPAIDANAIVSNALDKALKQAACPLTTTTSTGCTVTASTSTSFTYTVTGESGATYEVPSGTTFHKADKLVTAKVTGHPFVKGQKLIIRGCLNQPNSVNVTGLAGLPSGTSGTHITVSSVTTDTFTFNWDQAAIALPAGNVSCKVESALTAKNLINWVRGWDIAANEDLVGPCRLKAGVPESSTCPVTVRPSLHGDVLHSRPAVVNYNGNIVVFYGGNDGVFRAVNGNQSGYFKGVRPGGELWGFIAPEFHGKFRRLFSNAPLVDIAGVTDPDKKPKDYFFDGSTTVLRDERTGTTTAGKTYIYMTARRGGRVIYALDVTDPMDPAFLWSRSNADIPELGQTWSQPKVANIQGRDTPVLIMGAGYSPEQDGDPVAAADTMGRGVIALDAKSGEVVWAALANCSGVTLASDGVCVTTSAMTHSVPADVTLIDRNSDGYIDRAYAADTGANIWRIDLQPAGFGVVSAPSDWKITKLATLGGTGNNARKFLFGPDVIPTKQFDVVMAVSGDREHPLYTSNTTAGLAYNVQNRIYMLKDPYTGALMDSTFAALTNTDLVANPDSSTFNASAATVKGYYINLPNPGEKGVNAPVTIAGKTYFATNYPDVPDGTSCTADLGIALAYTVDFLTGKVVTSEFVGGGLPPSPVSGMVQIGDSTVPFVIGGAGPTTFDPVIPPIELNNNRKRAYWYVE